MNLPSPLDVARFAAATPVEPSPRPDPPPFRGVTGWLAFMLDEVDYGMLLVDAHCRVLHANHAAEQALAQAEVLQWHAGVLDTVVAEDSPRLREALRDAAERGLRCLLDVGDEAHRASLAVVPMPVLGQTLRPTLLVMGRPQLCETLSAQWFARSRGLTSTEAQVLLQLCDGAAPDQVALQQKVALSTVRTQISSIRAKTGAASLRALVHQVATLPPLINALRRRLG